MAEQGFVMMRRYVGGELDPNSTPERVRATPEEIQKAHTRGLMQVADTIVEEAPEPVPVPDKPVGGKK
jgi:hypothetical protein